MNKLIREYSIMINVMKKNKADMLRKVAIKVVGNILRGRCSWRGECKHNCPEVARPGMFEEKPGD